MSKELLQAEKTRVMKWWKGASDKTYPFRSFVLCVRWFPCLTAACITLRFAMVWSLQIFYVIQEVIQCSELNYFWFRLSNFRKRKWLLFKINFKNVTLTLLLEVSANIVKLCSCCACTMRSQLLQNSVWHVAHVTESGSSLPTTNENENWNQYWYKKAFR